MLSIWSSVKICRLVNSYMNNKTKEDLLEPNPPVGAGPNWATARPSMQARARAKKATVFIVDREGSERII